MRWIAVLGLVACHPDICQRDETVDRRCGLDHTKEDTQACQDSLFGCSKEDLAALDAFEDCKVKVGATACDPTTAQFASALQCLAQLDLSDRCHYEPSGAAF